jgi:hypothetical protein
MCTLLKLIWQVAGKWCAQLSACVCTHIPAAELFGGGWCGFCLGGWCGVCLGSRCGSHGFCSSWCGLHSGHWLHVIVCAFTCCDGKSSGWVTKFMVSPT